MAKVYVAYVSVMPKECFNIDNGQFYLSSPFPIDMLRYDQLYPHTEIGSIEIAASMQPRHGDTKDFPIVLTRWVDDKNWQPNRARWESFGWLVSNCRVETH